MDFKKYLEQNELTESQLTKQEVWQADKDTSSRLHSYITSNLSYI